MIKDADLLLYFEAQFKRSEDGHSKIKRRCKEDTDFSLGVQWDELSTNNRSVPGKERPLITVNKIDPLVYRIVNDAAQQELEAQVSPENDDASPHTSYVLEGVIRKIQVDSKAKMSYIWAYECAVRGGLGYFRVENAFEDRSFDQILKVTTIKDPNSVSFDPDCLDSTGKDSEFCIISEEISTFKAKSICDGLDEVIRSEERRVGKECW